jgi:8-oxo-dGTP diphosphatase
MTGIVPDRDRATRAAAYAFCVEGDRVLLERWRGPSGSAWILPGGGIRFGEDPATAVRREVLEGTAFVIELGDVLGIDSLRASVVAPNRRATVTDTHAIRIVYAGRVVGGLLEASAPGSVERFDWVSVEALLHQRRVELVDRALGWAKIGSFV